LNSKVQIIAGGNGALTATMKVEEEHVNRGGFLHGKSKTNSIFLFASNYLMGNTSQIQGGMTALLVDDLSGIALMTHPSKKVGVSLVMNIQ
jgi:acyl-coenzyme A thioesterase PaaI-like protein